MSNRSLVIWSLLLSLPAQYLVFLIELLHEFLTVGVSYSSRAGDYGCANYHSPGLWSCSLGEMLTNPLLGVMLVNALSFGLVSLVFAAINAGILGLGRALYRKARSRTD
ncbi:MAG: hypothetical protein R3358_03495 [Woeseiaceae bacterium]|nr:hypothetical protein [Woeseiaceae bacterium]